MTTVTDTPRQRLADRLARLVEGLRELGRLRDGDPGTMLDGDLVLAAAPADPAAAERWRQSWPAGLPLPLTVGAALAAVDAGRELVADAVAGDIEASVAALVEPEAQAAVLERAELAKLWPWRRPSGATNPDWPVGPSHAAEYALALVLYRMRDTAEGPHEHPSLAALGPENTRVADWWPPDTLRPDLALTPLDVTEWARERLNLRHPAKPATVSNGWREVWGLTPEAFAAQFPGELGAGDALVAEVAKHGRMVVLRAPPRTDGLYGELRPGGLALLCVLEGEARKAWPARLEALAWLAVRSWATADAPGDLHNAAARAVLEGQVDAGDPEAVPELARELWRHRQGLVEALAPGGTPPALDPGELRTRDGMLALDADLAAWLDTLDRDHGDKLRRKASERLANYTAGELGEGRLFKLWAAGASGALELAALVLWAVRVRERCRRKRDVPPALVRAVARDVLIPAMTRQAVLPTLDDGTIRDKRGRELGRIALVDTATLEAVRRGLDLLGTVTGNRLVRFLVHRVHDQAEGGGADPRAVELLGGRTALADVLHYTHQDFRVLEQLLMAGQHVQWTHPAVTVGGLWTWTERRGSRAGPGMVRIIVGDALAPGLAARLAQEGDTARQASIARRLVPELRHEPPVSAVRTNDQGAVWTLHRLALVELVDHAEDLYREGAVALPRARLLELASQARLPGDPQRVIDSWLTGDDVAPPLLAEPERGRFTLADPHAAERDFIADRGRRAIGGRANGRAAKHRKAERGKPKD